MILLVAFSLALSTEALIILSNFLLAISTFLLFFASLREQHATVQAITKSNRKLVRRLLGLIKGQKHDSD